MDGYARREARGAARSRPRHGDSGRRAQAHLPPFLSSLEPVRVASERYWTGPVHRSCDRTCTRRQGVCRKRRRDPRHNSHSGTTEGRSMSRVLVVEDEAHLAEGLRFNLEAEGHSVDVAGDGESAIDRLLKGANKFDAVVLDVMLPGMDGFDVVSALRRAKNYVPVLMLTARGRPEDVLAGFAAGTDDYLPKPFELPIFLARLQGLLRRSAWLTDQVIDQANEKAAVERPTPHPSPSTSAAKAPARAQRAADKDKFSFDGRTIDFANLELRAKDGMIQLTLMEAKLLRHLVRSNGQTVSRKSILEDVWGLREDTDTRAIDNFIVRLRRYIEEDPSAPRHLLTVRGIGYRFVP